MFEPNIFFSSVYVPNDLTAEAKSLIDKHRLRNSKSYIWFEELAKDLVNYVARGDLVNEIFNQINSFHHEFQIVFYSVFAESLTFPQIQTLTRTNYGSLALNRLFTILYNPSAAPQYNSSGVYEITGELRNCFKQSAMKLERFRNPVNSSDARPYIGDMVENNEGLQLQRDISNINNPWLLDQGDYRFSTYHDGEHILGNRNGSRVKAVAGLTGTILTYHLMLPDRNYAVYILLNDNKNVLILKDLINLSPFVLKAPCSTKGLVKENNGIPRFIDRNGRPTSKVKIGVGETIGYTAKWSGEENKGAIGLHFTIAKFQFVQQYRDFLAIKYSLEIPEVEQAYQKYLIVPCSAESPVRCK